MTSLLLVLIASQVAAKPAVKAPLCLTLVLERERYWLGAASNAIEPQAYPALAGRIDEIRRAFPRDNDVVIAPASDVPDEWVQDATVLLRKKGYRRVAIGDGALAAAAKKAPSNDWIVDVKWTKATLVPLINSQCHARIKAGAYQDAAPRLRPLSPPPMASRAKPTSQDALKGIKMCVAAANVPEDISLNVLAAECSRLGACGGSCAQALIALTESSEPRATCPELAAFQKSCSPVFSGACHARFTLSMVRGFVEATKTVPEGLELEKSCAPLLSQ